MRAIDADELMELLTTAIRNMKGIAKFIGAEDDPEIKMEIKAYTDIANGVKDMPTIEERKTGKWIYKRDLKQFFCDQCGYPSLTDDDRYIYGMDLPNFCEDCGADMRGEQDG